MEITYTLKWNADEAAPATEKDEEIFVGSLEVVDETGTVVGSTGLTESNDENLLHQHERAILQPADPQKIKQIIQRYPLANRHLFQNFTNREAPKSSLVRNLPCVLDDFYLNLLHWSSRDVIAIACGPTIHLYNPKGPEGLTLSQTLSGCTGSSRRSGSPVSLTGLAERAPNTPPSLLPELFASNASVTSRPDEQLSNPQSVDGVHTPQHDRRASPPRPANTTGFAAEGPISGLQSGPVDYTSIKWSPDGRLLAGGAQQNVEIWDAEAGRLVRTLQGLHSYRIAAMDWLSNTMLTSGSRDRTIVTQDLREPCRPMSGIRFERHRQEVCGLAWRSPDFIGSMQRQFSSKGDTQPPAGKVANYSSDLLDIDSIERILDYDEHQSLDRKPYDQPTVRYEQLEALTKAVEKRPLVPRSGAPCLASGANDNRVYIWELGYTLPVAKLCEHQAAVKALSWAPINRWVLATGGGTNDRTIRIWDLESETELAACETESQLCNLYWSPLDLRLVTSHGYTLNQLNIWTIKALDFAATSVTYPLVLAKMATLAGHTSRVLYMSAAPDAKRVASVAGDGVMRIWDLVS